MTETGPATAAQATFCPAGDRIYVLVAAILASSMGFIDGSVLSIATPAIRANLGATLADAQWISNAYLLFLSSLLLIGGAAGDRFGLRNVFALGILMFVAASLVCAVAPDPTFLIIARAVQGIGAALMVPGSLAIIAKAYPREERGKAIGLWSAFSSLTTILGPVIGGFVLTTMGDWSWRLVFAINLPLGGIALALLLLRVPADAPEPGRRLDLLGGALVTAGLLLVALGLTGTDGSVPMLSHIVIYCGIGLLALLGFLYWESRTRTPMLPLHHFRNVAFSGAQGLTFLLYFALAAVTFFLPMTMIGGWGVTAAEVSIAFLPFGIALTVLSPYAGKLADKIGPGPMITIGAAIVALAFALLGVMAPLQNVWLGVLPLTILMGIGMSAVVSPLSTAVMTSVEDRDTGLASGVNNAVARVAGLLAVALMGGVAAFVFERSLGGFAELPVFFGMQPDSPLAADAESARMAANDAAFAAIAYSNAALALISAVIAWFTQVNRLRKG
ncbi:MFS transporter [Devosia sp. ZB163]|uniref:MFS transporter n=1 Tax=Devosia sp. ZB163 TaxID=3025938 RepID=UPI0023616534|nr:MFS transporter [Devosia sp. ZB163]MDC9826562.1 MFS transporter [Devosia sp. ZB163]